MRPEAHDENAFRVAADLHVGKQPCGAGSADGREVRIEDQDLSPATSEKIKAMKSKIDQSLRRLIRAGVADGSIRSCDVKMTAFALTGALDWIAHWHRADDSLLPDEIATRLLDVFDLGLAPRGV